MFDIPVSHIPPSERFEEIRFYQAPFELDILSTYDDFSLPSWKETLLLSTIDTHFDSLYESSLDFYYRIKAVADRLAEEENPDPELFSELRNFVISAVKLGSLHKDSFETDLLYQEITALFADDEYIDEEDKYFQDFMPAASTFNMVNWRFPNWKDDYAVRYVPCRGFFGRIGHGVKKGAKATAHGVKKGAKATAHFVDKNKTTILVAAAVAAAVVITAGAASGAAAGVAAAAATPPEKDKNKSQPSHTETKTSSSIENTVKPPVQEPMVVPFPAIPQGNKLRDEVKKQELPVNDLSRDKRIDADNKHPIKDAVASVAHTIVEGTREVVGTGLVANIPGVRDKLNQGFDAAHGKIDRAFDQKDGYSNPNGVLRQVASTAVHEISAVMAPVGYDVKRMPYNPIEEAKFRQTPQAAEERKAHSAEVHNKIDAFFNTDLASKYTADNSNSSGHITKGELPLPGLAQLKSAQQATQVGTKAVNAAKSAPEAIKNATASTGKASVAEKSVVQKVSPPITEGKAVTKEISQAKSIEQQIVKEPSIIKEEQAINRASSQAGSKRSPWDYAPYQQTRNTATTINGRQYSGHALDRMQDRGIMPSMVEDTLKIQKPFPNKEPGRLQYYDSKNNISIITEQSGEVVTVSWGEIK